MQPTFYKPSSSANKAPYNARPQFSNQPGVSSMPEKRTGYGARNQAGPPRQDENFNMNNNAVSVRRPVTLLPKPTVQLNGPTGAQNQTVLRPSNLNSSFNTSMNQTAIGPAAFVALLDITKAKPAKVDMNKNVRYLTGTIEKIIKWHKVLSEFCHYEVIAPVVAIHEGQIRMQKIMLLRDKQGPVLKVVHYIHDRIDLPNFHIGQMIRCVGRMITSNTLQAINIRDVTENEVVCLPRLTYISDQEVTRAVASKAAM